MPPAKPLTRFIVLGQQRTGSNLLNDLLNSHSEVLAYGEIFNSPGTIMQGQDLGKHTCIPCADQKALVEERNADPVGFIRKYIFIPENSKGARTVGFKLFYEQYDKWFPQLESWLREETGLSIIHLKRENILRTLLSVRLANRSGIWKVFRDDEDKGLGIATPNAPITLEAEDCEEFFERTLTSERQADYQLRHQRTLNVYYEDLEKNPEAVLHNVCAFLGVAPHSAKSRLVKQTRAAPSELIVNYNELKTAFEKRPTRRFFED